uniref:Uncharacterized protein n=1 Tax=Desertifilum tharense IPPAS B-1220 TaxID=1781255 RepID=A0ACD5GW14_9CYAN
MLAPGDNTRFKDSYELTNVTVGQQIQIQLASAAFDTVLQLVNAQTGAILQENDDANGSTTNSQLTFTAQAGVQYLVRATSYEANQTGTLYPNGSSSQCNCYDSSSHSQSSGESIAKFDPQNRGDKPDSG